MRRGVLHREVDLILFPAAPRVDNRGNSSLEPDRSNPIPFKATLIPMRSARAEAPGNVEINVVRLICRRDVPIGLWSIVLYDGDEWDVVTPRGVHPGSVHTRNWTADIRRRPG